MLAINKGNPTNKKWRTYALFPFWTEVGFLCLPIFLFFFSFYADTFRIHHSDLSRESVALFFDLITIDAVHGFLTFYVMFALPEGRKFLKTAISKRSPWIFIASALTVALIADGIAYHYDLRANIYVYVMIASALVALRAQHTASQCLGIANLYNLRGKSEIALEEKESFNDLVKRERILFKFFVMGSVLQRLALSSPVFQKAKLFKAVSSLLLAGLVVPIIANALKFPGKGWRNKNLYLLRLFCFPVTWMGGLSYIAVEGLHGSEYGLLIHKMAQNSKSNFRRIVVIGVPLVVLALAIPILMLRSPELYNSIFGTNITDPRVSYRPLLVVYFVFQYLHFYLDGILFRFKDENVRSNIGPLLYSNHSSSVIELTTKVEKPITEEKNAANF